MKEISAIITAYDNAVKLGKGCALATVVHVEGSSYRRPGARMLVTDDGQLTGAISGGCLEGDALRKALLAISEGKNKLVTYDTTDEDDAKFGVQLGCNGIVHILFEPINGIATDHPLILLKKIMEKRRPAVLTTLFSLKDKSLQPGTCFFYAADEQIFFNNRSKKVSQYCLQNILADAATSLQSAASQMNKYEDELVHAALQFIPPPLSLIIVGAGNDAMPLVSIADILGWEVTLIDGRPTHATAIRFPSAKNIIIAYAAMALKNISIDDNTVCVLMTHNYNYDLTLLKQLVHIPVLKYIGILGPKTKLHRMYNDLEQEGISIENKQNIYGPVGLDIGAETPEEIALSIVAEIKAIVMKRNAALLRNKELPVHS